MAPTPARTLIAAGAILMGCGGSRFRAGDDGGAGPTDGAFSMDGVAQGDAASDGIAPGGRWCASQGTHTICSDFDDEPPLATPFGWSRTTSQASSTFALDANGALSPPRALRAVAVDNGAQLSYGTTGPRSFKAHVAFRPTALPCASSSLHVFRYDCGLGDGSSVVYVKIENDFTATLGGSGTFPPRSLGTIAADRWYRLVLTAKLGGTSRVDAELFEGERSIGSGSSDFTPLSTCTFRSLDVGPWVSGDGTCPMLLDNVWLDVE